MATEVEYLYGSESGYHNLTYKKPMAFYKTEKALYLGDWKLSNAEEIEKALSLIGDLSALQTSVKTSLVAAINQIVASSGTGSVSQAAENIPGIMKLYQETGTNTDGTMSQAAIKQELDKKAEIDSNVSDETLTIKIN